MLRLSADPKRWINVTAPVCAGASLIPASLLRKFAIARHLERRGLLVRDDESAFLTIDASDDATLDELRGHSITDRSALAPHAGRKAFTLQTLPGASDFEGTAAPANGFS